MRGATILFEEFKEPLEVSIHAPVRGATRKNAKIEALKEVSIHAPVRVRISLHLNTNYGNT